MLVSIIVSVFFYKATLASTKVSVSCYYTMRIVAICIHAYWRPQNLAITEMLISLTLMALTLMVLQFTIIATNST